jgi:hypothetical protein
MAAPLDFEGIAPDAVAFIREMASGSAERYYAAKYLAYRIMGVDDPRRPEVAGFGLGADHAQLIREDIDERLPVTLKQGGGATSG